MAKNVVVYSKANCRNCVVAKAYLDNKGVPYEEILVDQNEDVMKELISKGVRSMPFITINDTEIKGFKPQEIDSALNG